MSEPMSDRHRESIRERIANEELVVCGVDDARALLAEVDRLKALSSSPGVAPGRHMLVDYAITARLLLKEWVRVAGMVTGGNVVEPGSLLADTQQTIEKLHEHTQPPYPQPTPEGSGPAIPEDDATVFAVALATWRAVFNRDDFGDAPPVSRETYRTYARAAIRAINKLRGTP